MIFHLINHRIGEGGKWSSSCVYEARIETTACAHGTFAKNQGWKYFTPKSDWKFEGSISFRWRAIEKTMYLQCIAVIEKFNQSLHFSPKGKEVRPWFWGADRGDQNTHRRFFDQKDSSLRLRDAQLRTYKHMNSAFSIDPNRKKFPNFQIISITEIRFH